MVDQYGIKMKIIVKLLFICLSLSFLASCASIVTGTKQQVSISTDPVDGAKCQLTNKHGSWIIPKTPGFTTVHRDFDDLDIICKKTGHKTAHKTVKSHTKAMVFGNLIAGGVVGGGIDVVSGAAYNYPEQIIVPMRKA